MSESTGTIDVGGTAVAWRQRAGSGTGVCWLGGYRSDMAGTKAEAIDAWAAAGTRPFLRHDYSGHGVSGGAFEDGTISRWLAESLAVFRARTSGPQVLVGSSMGAWIALRMVAELTADGGNRSPVAGLLLIAPAPDFTVELIEPRLTPAMRDEIERTGRLVEPSEYGPEPTVYTRALIEDGRLNRVMGGRIDTFCPVHILQGMRDPDVPHTHALKLAGLLPADDVTLTLVPDGDHRLSRPQDIALMLRALDALVSRGGE